MNNSFTGLVPKFPNEGIHMLIAETIKVRKQVIVRPEFRSQSGWNDALNEYLQVELEKIAQTVKRVTYSPSETDPAAAKAKRLLEAKDTSIGLKEAFDGRSINADDLVMSAVISERELPWDFSGAHPDLPQPTPDLVPNDIGRMFVLGLDNFIVQATNLDSRHQPSTINAMEAAQLLGLLNALWAVTVLKGGEANRSETPTGVLPSQYPGTFNADGSADPDNKKK